MGVQFGKLRKMLNLGLTDSIKQISQEALEKVTQKLNSLECVLRHQVEQNDQIQKLLEAVVSGEDIDLSNSVHRISPSPPRRSASLARTRSPRSSRSSARTDRTVRRRHTRRQEVPQCYQWVPWLLISFLIAIIAYLPHTTDNHIFDKRA